MLSQHYQNNLIKTADGSLSLNHKTLDETYHSSLGAKTEAQKLYIEQSQLQQRVLLPTTINILDVGLGLGYNAIQTIECWLQNESKCDINLTSLENDLDLFNTLLSTQAPWQSNWELAHLKIIQSIAVRENDPNNFFTTILHPRTKSKLNWQIIIDDALHTDLEKLNLKFDLIWQDPFSPKNNPSLWSKDWFQKLKSVSHAQTEIYTYSVARTVKDALTNSGWIFQKIKNTGPKKHWLKASST